MVVRHFGFGNVGRDKNEFKVSTRVDRNALEALRDRLPDEEAAAFLCEINEGDDNNEMKLAQDIFKGWRLYGRNTREPILLSPDNPPAKATVFWVPNTAVAKWSPRRSVLVLDLADETVTLMGSHPAAGANGQGDRPQLVRPLLQTSWDLVNTKRNFIRKRRHHQGRNVIEMLDANAYDRRIQMLPRPVTTVFHDQTDWGFVYPAEGYTDYFRYKGQVPFNVDSHDGHLMSGRFLKRG